MPIGLKSSWMTDNKRIFIIEADEIVRSALQFMLSDDNDTHALASLEQAYAAGKRWKADLILLGLAMVRDHGLTVLGGIATRLPGAKILLIADCPDDPLVQACLAAGAHDVLGKPIAIGPVSSKVDVLLGARR